MRQTSQQTCGALVFVRKQCQAVEGVALVDTECVRKDVSVLDDDLMWSPVEKVASNPPPTLSWDDSFMFDHSNHPQVEGYLAGESLAVIVSSEHENN